MLMLKHPPMPEFSLFQKNYIVEVRCFSLKKIALEFFLNKQMEVYEPKIVKNKGYQHEISKRCPLLVINSTFRFRM